jgi:hypothetical protein
LNTHAEAKAWYQGKTVFIAFALLTTLTVVSVLVDIFLYRHTPSVNNQANFVVFTCYIFPSNQTFTLDVEVNLGDGIDQDEAIRVATKAHAYVVNMSQKARSNIFPRLVSSSSTAYVHENGIWRVKLEMAYTRDYYCNRAWFSSMRLEEFEATIDPTVHTVVAHVKTKRI